MINILFVYGIPHVGGTEAVMKNIFTYIDKKQYHIDFLFIGKEQDDLSDFSKEVKKQGSKIYYVPTLRTSIWRNHKEVKKILKSNGYDIIHSHLDASGADVLRIAKKCGVSVRITHSHNTSHLKNAKNLIDRVHRQYLNYQKRRLRKIATHFIGCSDLAGKWLFGDKICQQSNYMIFNNSIYVDKYRFNKGVRDEFRRKYKLEDDFVVGHIGRFEYQKNHEFLIDIFEALNKINKNSKLVLIGEGSKINVIKNIVKEKGLQKDVLFMGNVQNVEQLLQMMDVFIMPSFYEGLSVSLVEAQASGMPCLVSNTLSKQTNITGNVTFFDLHRSADQWAKKSMQLYNSNLRDADVSGLIKSKGFDMKTNINNLERFYSAALGIKKYR